MPGYLAALFEPLRAKGTSMDKPIGRKDLPNPKQGFGEKSKQRRKYCVPSTLFS
jgi:hypothetical protein